MPRKRKPAVVSPSPELIKSVLRRSTRLTTNRDGDKKPEEEEALGSRSNPIPIPTEEDEKPPPRKSLRELGREVTNRLGGPIEVMKKSSGSTSLKLKRSLRVSNWECSDSPRRSRRFVNGGGSMCQDSSDVRKSGTMIGLGRCNTKLGEKMVESSDRNCKKSMRRSRVRLNSKEILRDCDVVEEVSVCVDEECMDEKRSKLVLGLCARLGKGLLNESSVHRVCDEDEVRVCIDKKRSKIVTSSSEPVLKANKRKRKGKDLLVEREEEEEEGSKTKHKLVESRDGNRGKNRRSRVPSSKSKELLKACDEDEVSVCANERKKVRVSKPPSKLNGTYNEEQNAPKPDSCIDRLGTANSSEAVPKADNGKTKKKLVAESKCVNDKGWTKDQESALQRAYLTAKPSPNFWKKVSKMVHGKSAHECFDRMHKDLNTPPQLQPRSRTKKTTPQFSLSASKPLTKPRQQRSRSNPIKKTIRHLLEKQKDQSPGFDLFSVLEPNNNLLFSTPTEKTKKILEFPSSSSGSKLKPCSRFKTGATTTLISPPVLKQVKNKALHEKYIDQLHNREAKRKAESCKPKGKENEVIRRIDSVKAAKDALYFDVQDAIKKLKSIESDENLSEFCDEEETEEED